jgi:phosphoribosylformylglycinamidine cyclo-ligase
LPAGTALEVDLGSWPVPPIFSLLVGLGNLERGEAYRALNMGVGMVVVASPGGAAEAIEAHLDALGEPHCRIGRVVEGDRDVRLIDRG